MVSDVSADGSTGLYVAGGQGPTARVVHYSGSSTTADRVYGGPRSDPKTTHIPSSLATLVMPAVAADPTGGVYMTVEIANHCSFVLHFPGSSLVPDRAYATPDPQDQVGLSSLTSAAASPSAASPPAAAQTAAQPAAAAKPNWAAVLTGGVDPRISIVQCTAPDPHDPAATLCISTPDGVVYAAVDQASSGDIVGDGGTEAVIPLDRGGASAMPGR
jgi:hypothetical protein